MLNCSPLAVTTYRNNGLQISVNIKKTFGNITSPWPTDGTCLSAHPFVTSKGQTGSRHDPITVKDVNTTSAYS